MTDSPNDIAHLRHEVDVCVVGGGVTGVVAAMSAARHGVKVLLMHERPVLGGNSSSEIRMHICGADRSGALPNLRETGILEELRLENRYRNPDDCYSLWDLLLFEKVRYQDNLTLLLNCTCLQADMDGPSIRGITGWQLTTQSYHHVTAKVFVDCSGDGILAPLSGAEFRMGREGRDEYGESIAPAEADNRTMGMTCLFEARPHDTPQPFTPPPWAYTFRSDAEIPFGDSHGEWYRMGYWWIELGGEGHSIHDTEACRDELLKICLGVWDHIKNRGDHRADNWALEWLQFLPGKRESRRYIGDHVLTQVDIEAEGKFDDTVAYGGWTLDDHDPAGFWSVRFGRPATIWHPAPSPYGIPYRCLYSRTIRNLMFAGRCASATHAAMSSTRVMGTCASMGQAVGLAAAIAAGENLTPRQVGQLRITELQQGLLADDCYLPGLARQLSPLTSQAVLTASRGDPEPVRDGIDRPVGTVLHAWPCAEGDWIRYDFAGPRNVSQVTLVLDSMLDSLIIMSRHGDYNPFAGMPPRLPRAFSVDGLAAGSATPLARCENNSQRLVRIPVSRPLTGVRFSLQQTWGHAPSQVFGFYVE